MFKIIVAFDKDRVIGYQGWMPWNIKEDLQHFKEETNNSNLLMGSTTFNGLKKPLPNRITYVVSSKKVIETDNVKWVKDLDDFIEKHKNSEKEIFVCGGASIYKQLLPYTKKMVVSLVKGKHKSDTFFPDFNEEDFKKGKVKSFEQFDVYHYLRREEIK